MKTTKQIGDNIPLDLSDLTKEFLHEQALKWESRAWDAKALLERAEAIISQNDKEHSVKTGSSWLADFAKFQEQK